MIRNRNSEKIFLFTEDVSLRADVSYFLPPTEGNRRRLHAGYEDRRSKRLRTVAPNRKVFFLFVAMWDSLLVPRAVKIQKENGGGGHRAFFRDN